MSNIIIFNLPKNSPSLNVKINRLLKGIGAEKMQNSVWKSDNLRGLTEIAIKIRNSGGKATILEENVIY